MDPLIALLQNPSSMWYNLDFWKFPGNFIPLGGGITQSLELLEHSDFDTMLGIIKSILIQNISPVALLKVPEEGYIAVRGQLYRMEEGGLTWFLHSCVYYKDVFLRPLQFF